MEEGLLNLSEITMNQGMIKTYRCQLLSGIETISIGFIYGILVFYK